MWKMVVMTILLIVGIVLIGQTILNKHIHLDIKKKKLLVSIGIVVSTLLVICVTLFSIIKLPIVRTTTMDPGIIMTIMMVRMFVCFLVSCSIGGIVLLIILLKRSKVSKG